MKKTMSSVRVDERTISNMKAAIEKYNKDNLIVMSLNEFRRLSYETFAQLILQNKELPVKLK